MLKTRTVRRELTIHEAEQALQIDKNDLDEELIKQPKLLAEVGSCHVKANNDRDRAKDKMESVEAVAYLNAKDKAEPKSTDFAVKQEAASSSKSKKAKEEYRTAKYEAARWEVIWSAFMQRSFMLNKLAELYTAQFYTPDSSYERPTYERKKKFRRKNKHITDKRS